MPGVSIRCCGKIIPSPRLVGSLNRISAMLLRSWRNICAALQLRRQYVGDNRIEAAGGLLLRASLHDAAASKVHLHSLVDPSLLESSDVGYSFAWTTCRLPPKDTQQYAVQNRTQTGCIREANKTHAGSHTLSPKQAKTIGRVRNYNETRRIQH